MSQTPAGANPVALMSFALLAGLFLLGLGLQFFGDPHGGRPHISLALSGLGGEEAASLRLAGEGQDGPRVARSNPAVVTEDVPEVAQVDLGAIRVIPAEEASEGAIAGNPARPTYDGTQVRLAPAPVQGLFIAGEHGRVPVIGPNGERPADVYARPYSNPGDLPRIALVIGGLGLNPETTQAAIERLPQEVTLSFVPYADNLQSWIDQAREHGHEVIVELPLEPFDYPRNDPGPATLLTSNEWAANADNLDWVMSRAVGYVGLMNYQGARLTASTRSFTPVLQDIAARGLIYLDDGSSPRSLTQRIGPEAGGSWAIANRRIDIRRNEAAISSALSHLEATATEGGVAIGVGFAYPVTVNEIISWTETLGAKGFSLAPLSAATEPEAS